MDQRGLESAAGVGLTSLEYYQLQRERPELKLPDWQDLRSGIAQEVMRRSPLHIILERSTYILCGGRTDWAYDQWFYDVPF